MPLTTKDWLPGDNMTPEQMTRICQNIMYLYEEILPSLGYNTSPEAMKTEWNWGDYPFATLLNQIESNLDKLVTDIPIPPEWQPCRAWATGELAPTWQDANRWEGNVLAIYNMAQRIAAEWPRMGTFESGGILI